MRIINRLSGNAHAGVLRLAAALFAIQAGFHLFTGSLPVALAQAGYADAEVGVIVGTATLVQVVATLGVGRVIDDRGGRYALLIGAGSYVAAAMLMVTSQVTTSGATVVLLAARALQGVGIGLVVPAAMSLVPGLVPPDQRGKGLAIALTGHNLTMAVLPVVSLSVLSSSSLSVLALLAIVAVAVGASIVLKYPARSSSGRAGTARSRPQGRIRVRLAWTMPLLVALLFAVYWGAMLAYLPQRAMLAGQDPGLFFVGYGLTLISLRVPSGQLADRVPARPLLLGGLAITGLAIVLLAQPPSAMTMFLAGIAAGTGAALTMTPLLLDLERRCSADERGSAYALYFAATAMSVSLGSVATAPMMPIIGFEGVMLASGVSVACAAVLVAFEARLQARWPSLASPYDRPL